MKLRLIGIRMIVTVFLLFSVVSGQALVVQPHDPGLQGKTVAAGVDGASHGGQAASTLGEISTSGK